MARVTTQTLETGNNPVRPLCPSLRGFTLLEMLAVIALMAIAAVGLGVAVGKGLHASDERRALAQILASLRSARVQAVSHNTPVRLQFDLDRHSVHLPGQTAVFWPADMELRLTTAQGLGAAFEFYPDGASSAGNVLIAQGAQRWRIDIAWLTGTSTLRALP